jgi:hypothetical protein
MRSHSHGPQMKAHGMEGLLWLHPARGGAARDFNVHGR